MDNKTTQVTRRQFGMTALLSAAAVTTPVRTRTQDLDAYTALGLDRPFNWSGTINGHSRENPDDFERFLRPPEDRQYNPCAEAYPAAGTPRGDVLTIEKWTESRVFPQTERDICIYRPAQLSSSSARPDLMIFQDGASYVDPQGEVRVPAVLDTLIHQSELRPTVAVFVNPGTRTVPRQLEDPDRGRQRSVEYDTLTDAYVTFVLDELLPVVEGELGRPLSIDPARRMICGISSGGICAFTAAWFRPESFGRVLSHCGSFTNIRGGHNYPYLVRTNVRKPIRVFMTSGKMDLDIPVGNWPLANQEMAAALEYAGYEHRFVFGEGGHTRRHGGAIFADSLRWLIA